MRENVRENVRETDAHTHRHRHTHTDTHRRRHTNTPSPFVACFVCATGKKVMRQIVKRMLQHGIMVDSINQHIQASDARDLVFVKSEIPGDWKLVTPLDKYSA